MSTSARHTGAPTSRAISVRSYGGVDAISHPFNHNSLNLSAAKAPKRISGMPPLHDVTRDWVKRPEAVTNCWPSLQRDYIGTDKHHELDPWASKYGAQHDERSLLVLYLMQRPGGSPSRTGIFTAHLVAPAPTVRICFRRTPAGHFYHHAKADAPPEELAATMQPPREPPTPPSPTFRNAFAAAAPDPHASKHGWADSSHNWQHGPPHVMLNIRPPRPLSKSGAGFAATPIASGVSMTFGAGFAGSSPERPLVPKFLNLPVSRGPFERLEPPWGNSVPRNQTDGIIQRWPTMAG